MDKPFNVEKVINLLDIWLQSFKTRKKRLPTNLNGSYFLDGLFLLNRNQENPEQRILLFDFKMFNNALFKFSSFSR